MARLKTYTMEHHDSIAASRRNLREAKNRIKSETLSAPTKSRAKAKAKVKDEPEVETE